MIWPLQVSIFLLALNSFADSSLFNGDTVFDKVLSVSKCLEFSPSSFKFEKMLYGGHHNLHSVRAFGIFMLTRSISPTSGKIISTT